MIRLHAHALSPTHIHGAQQRTAMPLYPVQFVDHGDNVYRTHYFESYHDDGAITAARRMNAPSTGAGFEVWHEDRLVHRERNFPSS